MGIDPGIRNRVWFEMLEGQFKEDDVYLDLKKSKLINFNGDLTPYENLKIAVNTLENLAFD